MVMEFEGVSQATQHSYQAVIVPAKNGSTSYANQFNGECNSYNDGNDKYSGNPDPFEETEYPFPVGSLPVGIPPKRLCK
ncbi:hypothetical protein Nepgr_029492 [Nepenthes gracilis]|uniref:Uncharacterized protein n=1 Tax=Nepenthes gracilis TaxID=150966 RepID=A0AAD3TEJ1_NEPGR|nr:hypothetical protein Nepgr_029492 [Nepenthes gracilis]